MARRRSRRSRRHGNGVAHILQIMILILLPMAMLGGGGFGLYLYMQIEQIGADYCYARADQHKTAIFLDTSVHQNLGGAQLRDMKTALERAYDTAPPNAHIMIFTTARDSSGSLARPVFAICRPAETPAEQAALGAQSKTAPNLAHIAGEARAAFQAQVAQLLADARNRTNAAQESPILSQLQAISRYRGFQGQNRTLVVLTDGLENSETAQFGVVKGDLPPFDTFAKQDRYSVVAPDSFAGADVTLLLVESLTLPQPGLEFATHREVQNFWESFFKSNGADSVRLERLRRVPGS